MKILWRWHDSSETRVRVWRSDWFGDQFEILTAEQFAEAKRVFEKFSFPVLQAEDDL